MQAFKVIKSTRITVESKVAYGTRASYNQEEALALLRAERDRIESTMELLRREPTLRMRLKYDGNKVVRAQVLRIRATRPGAKPKRSARRSPEQTWPTLASARPLRKWQRRRSRSSVR